LALSREKGGRCGEIEMGNVARGRRVRSLLSSGGRRGDNGELVVINAGVDGHMAMHDETLHCVTLKS
jgi:hypothetical protein